MIQVDSYGTHPPHVAEADPEQCGSHIDERIDEPSLSGLVVEADARIQGMPVCDDNS